MRTNRHKVALVGLGTMGQRHARVLSEIPDRFDVVGAYDPRPEAFAPLAGMPCLPCLSCLPCLPCLPNEAEAIAACDVLIVATPIAEHPATVARALAAGKTVLVEKPLCGSAADAAALVSAVSRGRERLFVGHSERFNPVVRALVRLVRGESVLALEFQRVGAARPSECSVLVNLGVHDLDLAAYLGGGEATLRGAVGGATFADVVLSIAGGAVAHIHVDRGAPQKRRSITLTTPAWTYVGDLLSHRLLRTARDTGLSFEVPLPLEEPLAAQARALADALDGLGSRELATGIDGAAAVRLAELATRQCDADAEAEPRALRPRETRGA